MAQPLTEKDLLEHEEKIRQKKEVLIKVVGPELAELLVARVERSDIILSSGEEKLVQTLSDLLVSPSKRDTSRALAALVILIKSAQRGADQANSHHATF